MDVRQLSWYKHPSKVLFISFLELSSAALDRRNICGALTVRLPSEPFMAEKPYRNHAMRVVEEARAELERGLNAPLGLNVLRICAGLIWGVAVVVGLLFGKSLLASAFYGAIPYFAVILLTGLPFKKCDLQGNWHVKVNRTSGYRRGEKVDFLCERIVNGDVVESFISD